MAYEIPILNVTFVAGEALTSAQFKFVKMSADHTVVACAAVTDRPIGVLQNNPALGGEAIVCVIGVTKVDADAALAVGNLIGTSADGQAVAKVVGTDLTHFICGHVIQAVSNAGEKATAFVNCSNLCRAT